MKILYLAIGVFLASVYAVYSLEIFTYLFGVGMTTPIRFSLIPQIAIFPLYFSTAIPKLLLSESNEVDQGFPPVFILGVALTSLVLVAFVLELFDSRTSLVQWIKGLLGSGKLAFYLSTIMYGVYSMSIGWSMSPYKRGGILLALFYAACFILLVYVFEILKIEDEPLAVALACWLLLFSVGVWSEVEHYVTEYDLPMARQHFITISTINLLTAVSLVYVIFAYTDWNYIGKLSTLSVILLALISSGHLHAHYRAPYANEDRDPR